MSFARCLALTLLSAGVACAGEQVFDVPGGDLTYGASGGVAVLEPAGDALAVRRLVRFLTPLAAYWFARVSGLIGAGEP